VNQSPELTDPERLPSPPPSDVRLDSVPADSAQDLRFVQDRVGLFGKITFVISALFLIATSISDSLAEVTRYSAGARTSHLVGTLIALGLWRLGRSRRKVEPRALALLELAGTVGICWSFVWMGHHSVQPYGGYAGLLAVTYVNITRAMIVPSHPLKSLLLGVASFGVFIVSRATLPVPPELVRLGGSHARGLLEAILWASAGSAVATVASKVIYGLQAKAREARQLGQYTLEEKIGEGGMGEVYRAHHAMLRRPTAVKLLVGDDSEGQLRRFEKEVQLTARLTHPNTISIYDYGRTPDGTFYYAMELLDGLTLQELIDRHGPQPAGRVIRILQQVCGSLTEAHGIGLIHRDIKPANIHLCRRGEIADFVKVLDFGLVREIKDDGSVTQSSVNTVVGTPMFISPEAISSPDRMDGRADIYGLGCLAYFLLTGAPPFDGESVVELCAHHLHTPAPPPSERLAVPDDLERLVLSCLAKDPARRPQTTRALTSELGRCRDAQRWSEGDAEDWWTDVASAAPKTIRTRAESSAVARRTVCCGDLQQRMARHGKSA
jgi:eukaryotic-like serine/threonine-protein kinase